jgi:L-aspartate oxidase
MYKPMRYLIPPAQYKGFNVEAADVLIVGSGLSGLYTALLMDPRLQITVITKDRMQKSNSDLAQGGIAAAIGENDSPELHLKDTLTAGAGLCDPKAVQVLVDEAGENIDKLIELGVPFDRDAGGALSLTREGGHSQFRILHAHGDATGHLVVEALDREVAKRDNIRCRENVFLIDILTLDGAVTGALVIENERMKLYQTGCICIATGGIGQVYMNSTNPSVATGDGIAASLRAGADAADMEFIQFHPTVLYSQRGKRSFLISEAMRGEGAILRNYEGNRFMKNYHTLADMAPRDIVARAIKSEMDASDAPHVYLDITHKSREFLKQRFPTIFNRCLEAGIDISRKWIPVTPAQHYLMGGIKTDLWGRTPVRGLYACGECACTGVHGANRLASNSLLECLVFGARIARTVSKSHHPIPKRISDDTPDERREFSPGFSAGKGRMILKRTMERHLSLVRNAEGIEVVLDLVEDEYHRMDGGIFRRIEEFELYNMSMVAQQIADAALARRESVGSHYRSDAEEDTE